MIKIVQSITYRLYRPTALDSFQMMDRPIRPTTPNTVMYDEEEAPRMKAKGGGRQDNSLTPPAPVYVAPLTDSSGKSTLGTTDFLWYP